jgi:hypothetical protein
MVMNRFRNRFRTILDVYYRTAPSAQNAVDVFKGEWTSKFPAPYENLTGGSSTLFTDPRVAWALEQLAGVSNQSVLELGPLEGGHSYMLDQAGAASVLAIEANSRAYLKCLIAQQILGMKGVSFQLGDFNVYLDTTDKQFDFIHSAGVLYHMADPVRLLQLIAKHTRRTYIWTHYFDEKIVNATKKLRRRFPSTSTQQIDGQIYTLHKQDYRSSLQQLNFYGGAAPYSNWLTREDILKALKQFGFDQITLGKDQPDHPNGPNFELVAIKS